MSNRGARHPWLDESVFVPPAVFTLIASGMVCLWRLGGQLPDSLFDECMLTLGILLTAWLARLLHLTFRQRQQLGRHCDLLGDAERRYRDLYESAPLPYLSVDCEGSVQLANSAAGGLFGMPHRCLPGLPLEELFEGSPETGPAREARDALPIEVHAGDQCRVVEDRPPDGRLAAETVLEAIAGKSVEGVELPLRTFAGERRWVRLTSRPIRDVDGRVHGAGVLLTDISRRKHAEAKLLESEARFRSLFEGCPDAIYVNAPDGSILDVNPAASLLHRRPRPELVGKSFVDFVPADLRSDFAESYEQLVRGERSLAEGVIESPEGGRVPVELLANRVLFADRRVLVLHMRDITQRKQAEEQLFRRAFYDALTGLPNRALFLDRLEHVARRASRDETAGFAILFLDLDGFKAVNDSLGHRAGDQLLVAIARRLEHCVRPGDTVARLGGDEFTILLVDVDDVETAESVAERIHQELTVPIQLGTQEVFTATSIGIALNTAKPPKPAETLLRDADTAMYRAKAAGKSRHVVFDERMHEDALQRLKLETDLRHALLREQFRVHYQPIVDLEDGHILGFEAVVRWEHPTDGLLEPASFIRIAEETGVIHQLGEWVLCNAAAEVQSWRSQIAGASHLSLSVNISSQQFAQGDLLQRLHSVLGATGLPCSALRLEITESAVMQGMSDPAARPIPAGVQLCLDHFGTGYSSLSDLSLLPIRTLKIDRSFVESLQRGPKDRVIVEATISLAHSLGMDVVASGIENEWQLDMLRKLGCRYGQGYYFAPPRCAGEAAEMLRRPPSWVETLAGSPPTALPKPSSTISACT